MSHGSPYTCKKCDRSYAVYSSLRSHMLLKHTLPAKKCSCCEAVFYTTERLHAHMYRCMQTHPQPDQPTTKYQNQNENLMTKRDACVKAVKRPTNLHISMFCDQLSIDDSAMRSGNAFSL